MIPIRAIWLCISFGWLLLGQLAAQAPSAESQGLWYLRQCFRLADFDTDDQLNRAELQELSPQLDYYRDLSHFEAVDRNQDQLISFSEFTLAGADALLHRLANDEAQLRKLNRRHSHLADARPQYLKRHPEIAVDLLSNVVWTRENPTLVRKLTNDRSWLRAHPEVADAIQNNLIFWMEHPRLAENYYQRPPMGQNAALYEAWRVLHQNYLEDQGRLPQTQALQLPLPKESAPDVPPVATAPPGSQAAAVPNPEALARARQRADSLQGELAVAEATIQEQRLIIEGLQAPLPDETDSEALARELRLLRIEHRLARIVEDSLLTENIRYRKYITVLENERLADSAGLPALAIQRQQEEELMRQANRLERQNRELAARLDSLAQLAADQEQRLVRQQRLLTGLQNEQSARAAFEARALALESLVGQLQDSIAGLWVPLASVDQARQLEQLRIDSMRLELLQANLRSQRYADSLLYWQDLAHRRADSAAASLQLAMALSETQTEADSLERELFAQQEARLRTRLQFEQRLDSLQGLLQGEAIAYRDQPPTVAGPAPEMEATLLKTDEREALAYDNRKLRQQLEAATRHAQQREALLQDQLAALIDQNRQLEYQNRRLQRRRNRRAPLPAAVWDVDALSYELMETKHRVADLEALNSALLTQLQASQAYILQKLRDNQMTAERLGEEMAYARAQAYQVDTLIQALYRSRRVNWEDSIAVLQIQIQEQAQDMEAMRGRFITAQVQARKVQDSLRQEVVRLTEELRSKQNLATVDVQRINRLEAQDRQLTAWQRRLEEQRRLLDQRERMIDAKEATQAAKESKYQMLQQWENELKRREQALRNVEGQEP